MCGVRRTDQKPPLVHQIATLPEAEFKKLAAAVGRRLEKETNMSGQAIAAEADLNHDGVVTEAELSAWWRRRAPTLLAVSASRATEPPTKSQLMKLGLVAAVPCFTFGFLDNAIMLVAGEQIEAHLGMSLGLSAMACAAMGNIVADTTGQVSGGTVERLLRPVLPCARTCRPRSARRRARRASTRWAARWASSWAASSACFRCSSTRTRRRFRRTRAAATTDCFFAGVINSFWMSARVVNLRRTGARPKGSFTGQNARRRPRWREGAARSTGAMCLRYCYGGALVGGARHPGEKSGAALLVCIDR